MQTAHPGVTYRGDTNGTEERHRMLLVREFNRHICSFRARHLTQQRHSKCSLNRVQQCSANVERLAQSKSRQLNFPVISMQSAEPKSYTAMQLERKFSRPICSSKAHILTPQRGSHTVGGVSRSPNPNNRARKLTDIVQSSM